MDEYDGRALSEFRFYFPEIFWGSRRLDLLRNDLHGWRASYTRHMRSHCCKSNMLKNCVGVFGFLDCHCFMFPWVFDVVLDSRFMAFHSACILFIFSEM
jgi:hypothetical protein